VVKNLKSNSLGAKPGIVSLAGFNGNVASIKNKFMVRAKFVISHIHKNDDGSISVNAHPVHSGSEENKAFNDATPGGSLQLHIAADKPAQKYFIEGKEYHLDFTVVN
jgi:hypothetical protein